MKCIIKCGFWRKYRVIFGDCANLNEVRKWLNGDGEGMQPFVNIGNKRIIRLDAIIEIVPDYSLKEENIPFAGKLK